MKVLKYIVTLMVLIILFNASLYIVSLIPSKYLRENVKESVLQLEKEEGFFEIFGRAVILDNFMDALMINEAYSIDSTNPLESYLRVRKNYDKELTKYELREQFQDLNSYAKNLFDSEGNPISDTTFPAENKPDSIYFNTSYNTILELKNFLNGNVNISVDYARYYHGYLVYLRPLLLLFNINQIRYITLFVFLILLIVLAYELNKKLGKIPMFAIVFSILLFDYLFIPFSIDFAPGYLIFMIFSILLLLNIEKISWSTVKYMCFIIGAIICYFDYLNVPVLTLSIPLLIYTLYITKERKLDNKELFKNIFISCVLWSVGYIVTWVSKWVVYEVFMDDSIFNIVLQQIKYRSATMPHDFVGAFNLTILHFSAALFIFILATFVINKKAYSTKNLLNNKETIAFICLIPIMWDIVTFNHFVNHSYFTYRDFTTLFIGFWLFYFDYMLKKNGIKKSKR